MQIRSFQGLDDELVWMLPHPERLLHKHFRLVPEVQAWSSSSSQIVKRLFEVIWSLLLWLNMLIQRVTTNLKWIAAKKFWEQIIGFERNICIRLMWNSRCKFFVIVWFTSFVEISESVFFSNHLQNIPKMHLRHFDVWTLGKSCSSKQSLC